MLSYTGNFEDVLLERCFREVDRGFYIDIGAHHPTHSSVTRWFYDRGWSGINIEPGSGIEAFRLERTRDVNLELAVADFEGEATFWVHTANTGTSTLSPDVPEAVSQRAGEIVSRQVRVSTLPAIVEQHAPGRHIHFLKIDAEGAENQIVLSADWGRHRPEVVVIESTVPYTNTRRVEAWQDCLERNAYRLAYFDGVNDFWVREESSRLLNAFAVPVNVLDFFKLYDPELEALRAEVGDLRRQLAQRASAPPNVDSAVSLKALLRGLRPRR
jgi:FkbM family methyltransferase